MNVLNNLSVALRLRLGFGIVLALLVVVAAVGLARLQILANSLQEVAVDEMRMLQRIALLQTAVLRSGSAVRDAVAQEDLKVLKESIQTIQSNEKQQIELIKEIEASSEEGGGNRIAGALDTLRKETQSVLDLVDAAEYDLAKKQVIDAVRPQQYAAVEAIAALFKEKTDQADQAAERANAAVALTRILIVALSLVAVIFGLGIAWLVSRSITQPLRTAAAFARQVSEGDLSRPIVSTSRDELGALLTTLEAMRANLAELIRRIRAEGEQVSSLASDLAGRTHSAMDQAQVQSDRIVAVSAALEQMSASIRQVSESAGAVKLASAAAQELTRESNDIMQANLKEVAEVLRGVGTSGEIVQELSQTVAKISDMAQVIKDIADQTNLLALNAAIEAARAGEQGRGFAVVADEVRKLAERTADSTADIAGKVQEIGGRSQDAVQAMSRVRTEVNDESGHSRQVGEKLERLMDSARHVAEQAGHIASATQEQSDTSQTMTSNMYEINQIADRTLDTIRTAGATAERMDRTAGELRTLVERFRL